MNEEQKDVPFESDIREAEGDRAQDDSAVSEVRQRRFSRGERVVIGVLALLIGVAAFAFVFTLCRVFRSDDDAQRRKKKGPAKPAKYAYLDGQEMGAAEAKVGVLCLLPLKIGCQEPTIEYIHDTVKKHADRMHVRFVDFRSSHGMKEAKDLGFKCASLVINETNRFKDASGRDIELCRRDYSLADVHYVLQKVFDEAYGKGVVTIAAPPAPAAE